MTMKLIFGNALVVLLVVVVASASADKNLRRGQNNNLVDVEQEDGERRLFSFWALLFTVCSSNHGPLGPHHGGPLGNFCDHNFANSYTVEESDEVVEAESDPSAATYYSEESQAGSSSSPNVSQSGGTGLGQSSMWFLIVAGMAAAAALAAIVVGQRRDRDGANPHPNQGIVSRRMTVFSSLAQGNLRTDGST